MDFSILLIYLCPNHTQFYFMKKLFLVLLAAATVGSASAQPNSWLLYGNVNFSSETDPAKTVTNQWNITPGIGYQFNTNWTAGLNLSYGQVKVTPDGAPASTDMNAYALGVFGRYTHTMGSTFYCFGQMDISYVNIKDNITTFTNSGPVINLWPALGINVGKGYALNFSLGGIGYSSMKWSYAGANADNKFVLNFGQTLMVGLSKNFACKMHGHHKMGDDMHEMKGDDDDAPKKHKKAKKADKDDE
jgi:hypothetical protein